MRIRKMQVDILTVIMMWMFVSCHVTRVLTARYFCPTYCRCVGHNVDCSNTNLTIIPEVPTGTVRLNMSNTILKTIQSRSLSQLTNLEVLDLYNVSLTTELEGDVFRGLTSLKYLNISLNEQLPLTNKTTNKTLFKDLTSLLELRMYGNTGSEDPGTYPDQALSYLISLKELWIDGMKNRTLRNGFRKLTNLTTLRFAGDHVRLSTEYCNTDLVAHMFTNVENITNLSIRKCGVKFIDSAAFTPLKKIQFLDLSLNKYLGLETATKAIYESNITSVKVLKLNHIYDTERMSCGVVIIESYFQRLKNLQLKELHLEFNILTSVKVKVFEAVPQSLEALYLSNNEFRLHEYVLYISNMTNITKIDLSYQFFPNLLWGKFEATPLPPPVKTKSLTVRDKDGCGECNKYDTNESYLSRKKIMRGINSAVEYILFDIMNLKMEPNYKTISRQQEGSSCPNMKKMKTVCPKPPFSYPPIQLHFPRKLEYLDISHSKLTFPIFNLTINSTNSVKVINASSSMLFCWDGPVYGLNKLEYVDLSHNYCTRVRIGFFDTLTNLKTLILRLNVLGKDIGNDKCGELFQNLTQLEILDISRNRLNILSPLIFQSQTKLKLLNLSLNVLENFNVKLSHMSKLGVLDLHGNALPGLNKEMRTELETFIERRQQERSMNPLTLNMTNNSIMCDQCTNLDFLKWLQKYDRTQLRIDANCLGTDTLLKGNYLDDLIATQDKECASKESNTTLIVCLTISLMVVLNIVLGSVVYKFRWKLRFWFYVASRKIKTSHSYTRNGYMSLNSTRLYEQRNQFKYDAFVASSEADSAFVVDNMKRYLADQCGMRLCIPEIDFVPGQSLYSMIGNAIHVSRVTIFVTSRVSLQDREWEIAMRMAQEESLQRGRKVMFAIFVEDIPQHILASREWIDIREIYKSEAYVDHPENMSSEEMQMFWRDFMRHPMIKLNPVHEFSMSSMNQVL